MTFLKTCTRNKQRLPRRLYLGLQLQLLVEKSALLQDLHLEALFVPVQERGELASIGQPPLGLHHLLLLPPLGRLPLILVYPVQDKLHYLVAHNHPGTQGREK